MTDRYHSLTVVLEKDIISDDCQPLIQAIEMLKGVISCKGEVANSDTWMAEERARRELGNQLIDIVYPRRNQSK